MSNPDLKYEIANLHALVADLLKQEKSEDEIIHTLVKKGYESHYAKTVIENVYDDIEDQKSLRSSIIMGSVFILGGIILNHLSYRFALITSSFMYVVFWGIIVTGIITIARGIILYKK